MSEQLITHDELLAALDYDPDTGVFTWKIKKQRVRIGRVAGGVERCGYRRIRLNDRRYLAHRLAWFYVHKVWPVTDIDHRDMNRDHNAIGNLREATDSQNHANMRQPRGTKAPLKGAHWNRFRGCWQSYIKVMGKSVFLGHFGTPEDAHAAYVRAAAEHYGEFGRAA